MRIIKHYQLYLNTVILSIHTKYIFSKIMQRVFLFFICLDSIQIKGKIQFEFVKAFDDDPYGSLILVSMESAWQV